MKNTIFSLSEKSCSECRFWTNFCNFMSRKIALLLTFYNKVLLITRGRVPIAYFKIKICYI